eukprot:Seg797.3 transcript_id=Seg797.3/GoldUCD/mRNA.D3Y31 product="Fukutin-related protein" protein_id=Seg797.3/GoldUCD/D3Y31
MFSRFKTFHLVIFITVVFTLFLAFTRMSGDARENLCSKCLGNSVFETEDGLHVEQLEKRTIDMASLKDKSEYQKQVKSGNMEENFEVWASQYEIKMRQRKSVSTTEMLDHLQMLVSDLIELRATVEGQAAEVIEEKYNKFQKFLLDFESKDITDSKNIRDEENEGKNEGVYYCREERIKSGHGRIYERKNCLKIPISESVTILLDSPGLKSEELKKIARNIRRYYDNVTIKMVIDSEVTQRRNMTRSMIINEIIQNVTTPFVFVARYLSSLEDNIDLDRLIEILSTSDEVIAVGGAVTNDLNGVWSNGCLQTRLKNYTLTYKTGYYSSKHSCLKCDVLTGPFIARTKTLRKFAFREELEYGFYEDWLLGIKGYSVRNLKGFKSGSKPKRKGYFYSCPDVMAQVKFPDTSKSSSAKFANFWDIKRIVDADGKIRWYGCKRGIKHRQNKCRIGRGMAVPPCCLENLADAIKFIMKNCEDNDIICELQEGTLLGALKFQKVLPWERDADISFLTKHFGKLKMLDGVFEKEGYKMSVRAKPWCCRNGTHSGGAFLVSADGWNIEMYGSQSLDSHENIKQGKSPTKVNFAGQMVNVPNNPGKVMRERYGNEIYKHAEHWMNNRMNSGWDEYHPGSFNKCEIPGHHGCLDQYEADASQMKQAEFKASKQEFHTLKGFLPA